MTSKLGIAVGVVVALTTLGCEGTATASGGTGASVTSTEADPDVLQSADEKGAVSSELSNGVAVGSTLKTTAALNLRTGPGMDKSVRLVIPSGATVVTVNQRQPSGSWYNVKFNGVEGWSYGSYLTLVSGPSNGGGSGGGSTGGGSTGGTSGGGDERTNAVARAKSGVGFSYWWGHGRWIPNGATSSAIGACTGSCPNCTHSGSYGADCSGYVGKIWQVPSSNSNPQDDAHPYSTATFIGANSQWRTVSRGAVQPGDALVYNSNGAGHIFLFESGDGWGSMWAYEAKGCAIGIVHDLRTASSAYKAIAHY